ncbi:YggS family pyridoxal phosphate-dependent enzyme [Neomegalonema sp.]|uniref:YggS family pyridoxal phosphate-dependent enzyme n=1 Tax=Neomegalonema sp. TaxID=2039713 RepID=UPI002616A262|nr:YggS family pyridoxal phosphate-dependent enzyme [Neomegalonema sp.]MDD2869316.1 YggS family pyridoxal phosphate-dependent enzyme [Neomegalonema sp.]
MSAAATPAGAAGLSPEEVLRFGEDPQARFAENLAHLEARISTACARAGRAREEVRLLPVSKTVPAHVLRLAHAAGLRAFAENRIQEAVGKRELLGDLDVDWSIVGHLQTNKTKPLALFARELHALDSLRLAEALDRRLEEQGRDLDVFVQVNVSGEESKFGLSPGELPDFLDQLDRFPRLRPRGLMTLALFSADLAKVRPCFVRLRELGEAARRGRPGLTELSMGMSGDFEEAVAEGATVIRVGQAIFGRRPTPDARYWPGFAET